MRALETVLKMLFVFFFGVTAGAQTYDVYESTAKIRPNEKLPVVIFVHGGAWVSGSKEQYAEWAKDLAKNPVCVVVVGYSLAPKAVYPQPIEDLQRVLQLVVPRPLGKCDWQNWLYLMGHSAGAHTIAQWNTKYSNEAVRGFIGLEGIYDIPAVVKRWPDYGTSFIPQEFGADKKKWAAASPQGLEPQSTEPWLVVHSEKDELVEIEQSEEFAKFLRSQVIQTELFKLKSEKHFGVVEALRNPESDLTKKVLEFTRGRGEPNPWRSYYSQDVTRGKIGKLDGVELNYRLAYANGGGHQHAFMNVAWNLKGHESCCVQTIVDTMTDHSETVPKIEGGMLKWKLTAGKRDSIDYCWKFSKDKTELLPRKECKGTKWQLDAIEHEKKRVESARKK